jgi:predicted MPP superfamily phosphohydrolase
MRGLRLVAGATAVAAAYSLWEPFRPRLTIRSFSVKPPCPRLSILHISDLHLGPRNRPRTRHTAGFVRDLPKAVGETPDLVLATGDLIEGNGGIDLALEVLSNLPARLGRFYVLGSHDYYASEFQSYAKYFTGRRPARPGRTDTASLERGLQDEGWMPLTNTTHIVQSPDGPIRLAGVDDPYLRRHHTEHIERSPEDVAAIGLVHSPDVVSEWALAGFDLVVAGHTHAGQVRLPAVGAIVTNCSLPAALAGGLHTVGSCRLHVSPGLGTGRFAPIRFLCPPEATLLNTIPAV